jgi:cation diffusion facilitator CzcD-associated flavoprotein CzcO
MFWLWRAYRGADVVDGMAMSKVLDAIIIGAGFSGLYQLYRLRDKLSLSVRLLEAAPEVGGTWYWNRYPGARCDSESHSYCYTFSDELTQEWDWSERYPSQTEVLRYLNHVADRFDLRRDITFNTRVTAARYDETANLWRVSTEKGEKLAATFLITAVGCLSAANVPDIPGLSTFKGACYHTSRWPHEGVNFEGKRVGLVGTASTGIQAAPVIAETCAHLTVFQRTANYSVPARNAPLTPEQKRLHKENAAENRRLMHASTNGHPYLIENRSALATPPAEREAIYEAAWAKGGLSLRPTFSDLMTSKEANDTLREFVLKKIRAMIKDPVIAAKLTDIDHPYAAKRPPIDTNYFEAFNRPNVQLVDIRETPIAEVTPDGVRTQGGFYPLDVIVFATGFDAMTGSLLRLNITGRGGFSLAKAWEAGARTYLGLQVAGFPNLFTVTGPGSPSVLCNVPVPIEQHVEWITDCIAHMRARGLTRIETTPEAVDNWVTQVNAAANATLLSTVKHSWYLGANVPGKPRVFMPYAGGMARYRKICADVAANGYEGFVLSA